jgi:hypothetical protein
MRLYTVHLPAGPGPALFERAEFVRDGFNLFAFLFSALWCIWKGLWVSAVAMIALIIGLVALGRALGLSSEAEFWLQFVLALLFGLEASNLIRFRLRRRGYTDAGSVAADNLGDAEAIFFARAADEMREADQAAGGAAGAAPAPRRKVTDIIGLFPEYRGR